ncbi:J domain-containing protein [Halorussus sp. MSC15.2]|uniref:J domain-containing protein n=1 Tax=Halorussus sp. MSC15.2 TaxID=2283638 RepID=UPI0013D48C0D|nr:DnaJ domain-containing protein [Halorussus sp. MSC15.2]NEU55823.1 DnaJ domain-containing protein [Halorussus sp. MSC15.2]
MQQDRLLFGLAAVLAGIATLEFVLAFVYTPALFAIAVPFAVAAYLVWYHASGRLREQVVSGRAREYRRAESETGGFGAGPRDSFSGRRGGFDDGRDGFGARGSGERRGARGARGQRAGGARTVGGSGPTAAEAYRVLGLDADADSEAVRRAYREKVKAVHPDRESGDEEEFKRVKEAYEVLDDRN